MERQWRYSPGAQCRAIRPAQLSSLNQHFLAALCLAAAACLLAPAAARAAGDAVTVGDGEILDLHGGAKVSGMPASNARVKPILAAHPDQLVVICVAGCDGKPKAVQILPRPVAGRTAEYVPSSAKMDQPVYGPPQPGKSAGAVMSDRDDVICVAGCTGRPGQVLQRISGLPPPRAKARSRAAKEKLSGHSGNAR